MLLSENVGTVGIFGIGCVLEARSNMDANGDVPAWNLGNHNLD
jgi:hypothetical protein